MTPLGRRCCLLPLLSYRRHRFRRRFVWDSIFRMTGPGADVPPGATPTLTFTDRKVFEFKGEPIEMRSESGAQTDGDSIVFFRGSNVISAGDVFLTTGYPVIDLKRGGSIQARSRR